MNQIELKKLFKSSVKNGHINNNHLLPFLNSQTHEIKIKEEGYFRNFDLVIALINKENKPTKKNTIVTRCLSIFDHSLDTRQGVFNSYLF